jgi:hypothetical protein
MGRIGTHDQLLAAAAISQQKRSEDGPDAMQDVAVRARVHTAQVTKATAEWSAGYKQGCSDMIEAMAALRGGVASQHDTEKAKSAK